MKDSDYNYSESDPDEFYPDFFIEWNEAVRSGKKPGFYEPEELTDIIEIYIINNKIKRAKQAINYALRIYEDDDELLDEILLMLNDYERWNELLEVCDMYKEDSEVWIDGHKLMALLHLGMEEEAFTLFKKLTKKYADDKDELSVVYQAMAEALFEVDLFDASIEVMREALNTLEEDVNFYWLQLQCYVYLEDKKAVGELADIILKKNPLDAETWHRLGFFFRDMDEREKAIEAFEYAQSLGIDSEEVLINLIYIYDKNKNYKKALEKAEEYITHHPDSSVIIIMAAKLNSQMENWTEAVKYVDMALKITPDVESLYLSKSNFLLHLDEYKKAKSALRDGLKNTKDSDGSLAKKLSKLNKQYPEY